jgi:hypothetical protein
MAKITITLISLLENTSPNAFLIALEASNLTALTIARVIQWIVVPTHADRLLDYNWEFMLVLESSNILPLSVAQHIAQTSSVQLQVAEDFIPNFNQNQEAWLHPIVIPPPKITLSTPPRNHTWMKSVSSQHLQYTPAIYALAQSTTGPLGTISFLNFISLQPFSSAHESFASYKQTLEVGPRREQQVFEKITGILEKEEGGWDEVSLQQAPTLLHYMDGVAGGTCQKVNTDMRSSSLRNVGILMVSEIDLYWNIDGR